MSITDLRKFHNYIKSALLEFSSKNGKSTLLDIAVGRGGDLFKWHHNKFKIVIGFDPHQESINEAKNRLFSQLKTKKIYPFIKFYTLDMLDYNIIHKLNSLESTIKGLESHTYDVVSCQFAFHYFVKHLDHVLNFISQKLNTGGIFIGTATDGDMIYKLLEKENFANNLLNISKIDNEKYTFNITSESSDTYFDVKGESCEYFLFKDNFIRKAQHYNLQLLEIKSFSEWYELYPYEMSEAESKISFLNFSFVFIKFPT